MGNILIKRVYEEPSAEDGYRILVDRLWPRGVSKESLRLHEWNREVAPSNELRKRFVHKPELFEVFVPLYQAELRQKSGELQRLRMLSREQNVTLLYASREHSKNHAAVLREMLISFQ